MAVVPVDLRNFAIAGELSGKQPYGRFMRDDGQLWNGTAWEVLEDFVKFMDNLPVPQADRQKAVDRVKKNP